MTAETTGIAAIDSVARTVADLGAAERFYREALCCTVDGAPVELQPEDCTLLGVTDSAVTLLTMRLGAQRLVFLRFAPQGRTYPADSTASDLWFQHCAVVVGNMPEAHARVMAAGARPITQGGPQRLPANTGGVTAFKFRDPFGHPLELLQFPPGVGAAVWQQAGDAIVRGIDHTAIAVSSREGIRDFYTRVLGLGVADTSRNRGPEQSRLDAVTADEVDVTALEPRRRSTPHLELLAYRTGTRRALMQPGAADAAVSRTLASGDIDALAARLDPRAVTGLRHGRWQGCRAMAFHDPDNHAWICREPS